MPGRQQHGRTQLTLTGPHQLDPGCEHGLLGAGRDLGDRLAVAVDGHQRPVVVE